MSECRWLPSDTLTIQIRPDLSVYVVNLPEDLTPEESRKIGRVVGSLIDDGLFNPPSERWFGWRQCWSASGSSGVLKPNVATE